MVTDADVATDADAQSGVQADACMLAAAASAASGAVVDKDGAAVKAGGEAGEDTVKVGKG